MNRESPKPDNPKPDDIRQRRGFVHNLKWLVVLWCVGVGAAWLLALPFHLLVTLAMRK